MVSQPAREIECSEKCRLADESRIAAADYSRTVQVLTERSGVMSIEEYTRIREFSEQARGKSEAARAALNRHIAEHGC